MFNKLFLNTELYLTQNSKKVKSKLSDLWTSHNETYSMWDLISVEYSYMKKKSAETFQCNIIS